MANESRREAFELVKPFVENSQKYGFYQAIRWLNDISKQLETLGYEPLKLKILPRLSLDFISQDISQAKYHEKDHSVEIIVTFLALYGTASPLPTFYTEDLIFDLSQDITVSKDFLDLFHQKLYQKLYDIWLKYRLNQCAFEHKNLSYINKLYHLIGLGDQTLRKMVPNAKSLLKYIGLFNQQPRSAKALETLLKDYFDVDLSLLSAYKSKEMIDKTQQVCLGVKNHQLGQSIYLGESIDDVNFNIGLNIKELSYAKFNLFSYKQAYSNALAFLIKFFLSAPFNCFVKVSLRKNDVNQAQLGNSAFSQLGQNTWLGYKKNQRYETLYKLT